MSGRAWPKTTAAKQDLIKLTSKILFDSKNNFKTVHLAFNLFEASLGLETLLSAPSWVEWLQDFFVVVDYPVEGYKPPAILTEMQFKLERCSLELTPKAHDARSDINNLVCSIEHFL